MENKERHTGKGDRFYTAEELRKRLSISTLIFWEYRPIGQSALEELARHVEGTGAAISVENFTGERMWVVRTGWLFSTR